MAHREIGQEEMFAAVAGSGHLDGLDAGIDWGRIEALMAKIYARRKGEKAWPPLALFKALLLGTWHDLSDVRLAEALEDRASFRRFCGFSRTEATPERTAFVRFRAELAKRKGLSERLFDEVTRQLTAQGLMVRSGTLVDATVIPAAPGPEDAEAGWNLHTRHGPVKGYKAHISTDRDSALVRKVHVTPANELDAWSIAAVLGARGAGEDCGGGSGGASGVRGCQGCSASLSGFLQRRSAKVRAQEHAEELGRHWIIFLMVQRSSGSRSGGRGRPGTR